MLSIRSAILMASANKSISERSISLEFYVLVLGYNGIVSHPQSLMGLVIVIWRILHFMLISGNNVPSVSRHLTLSRRLLLCALVHNNSKTLLWSPQTLLCLYYYYLLVPTTVTHPRFDSSHRNLFLAIIRHTCLVWEYILKRFKPAADNSSATFMKFCCFQSTTCRWIIQGSTSII